MVRFAQGRVGEVVDASGVRRPVRLRIGSDALRQSSPVSPRWVTLTYGPLRIALRRGGHVVTVVRSRPLMGPTADMALTSWSSLGAGHWRITVPPIGP